jgi:serine/threonine protein kinase
VADGDKPDVGPTADHRSHATLADSGPSPATSGGARFEPEAEAPLATMQMPRERIQPATAPPDLSAAAPLLPTAMPTTAMPWPAVAPPMMPRDWRYALHAEIARGGMGRVVEATDIVLGRTVAFKEALSIDPETLRRFQRETRITARLEHPAIVPVHDAGITPSGAPYYVMRKVSGRALEELVARANELNDRLALVPHIVAAAHAIAHAHARGIVHRDIKPSNILVGDLGETIVIDWGLAKAIGEADDSDGPVQRVLEPAEDTSIKTRAGVVFGTPGFMAPEQLRGAPVDERCDVYALGATLYHLLARRPAHHHKRAEHMMRAAVDGPPTPLAAIVQGVPPELATIVDKALAHDACDRYQDAGALAEDLQRFLTGQLVASHHYTARERLVRYVRKHQAAFAIAALSTVAIVAGSVFSFVRITSERNRANEQAELAVAEKRIAEQQREEVTKKARELTLTNARHASATDPTRAVAMVKPLASSELWRHARDVGAAARAHGVAFSLPASRQTLSLELSRDGQRALVAGDDGIVRIVDLERRTAKELANLGGAARARFADGERKIVLVQGNQLTIIDTTSNARREITAPTPIARLEISGPLAYWVDSADAVWKLDLAGGSPVEVSLSEPVKQVLPSPDGRWLAFGGTRHLLLADRSRPTLPPEIITEGVTHHLSWSADSQRLAVQIDDEVIDINTVPAPQIFDRYLGRARFGLAYSGGKIYSSGPLGVRQLSRPEARVRVPDPGHTLGVQEGRDRVVISAKPQGEIVVLSEYGDHTLKAPVPIHLVATSARGPWIVAAAEQMLLVWSLDGFEPRAYENDPPTSARFVTPDTMIVTYFDDSAEWIDLRTREVTTLGMMSPLHAVVAAPDGAEAIAIDSTRKGWRVAGVGKPLPLPGETMAASFVDNTRVVIAGEGGLRLEDQRLRTQLALLAHAPDVRALVTTGRDGGWIAASFADGLVWRKHLAGKVEDKLVLAPIPGQAPIALGPSGVVVIGAGTELKLWRPDGTVDTLVADAAPIVKVALVEPGVVLALSDDGSGRLVDLPTRTVTALPVSPHASIADDGGLVAAPTVSGGVEIIDAAASWRWPLASPQKGMPQFSQLEIARDGSRVLALTQHSVVVWNLELPRSAEDTASWLDRLTNVTADRPNAPLTWQ